MKELKLTKLANFRYRQLKVGDDYYLVDLDARKWLWLCPTLYWKFPVTVKKLDKPMDVHRPTKSSFLVPTLLAPPLTILLNYMIPKQIYTDNHIGNVRNSWLIFIAIQLILLIVRYIISWRLAIPNNIGEKRVKLTFSKSSDKLYYQKRGLGTVLIVALIVIIFDTYISNGNLMGLFCLVCLSIIYYCSHLFAEAPENLEDCEFL